MPPSDQRCEPPANPRCAGPDLAARAMAALRELVRGLEGEEALDPRDIHRGLLTAVMRLIFALYAEERGLSPAGGGPGIIESIRRLQADADGATEGRGATWPALLARLRELVGDRATNRPGVEGATICDAALARALRALLVDGGRLSDDSLALEELGGVYESLIERRLARARGPSVEVGRRRRVVDLAELLSHEPGERAARLTAATGHRPDPAAQEAIAAARTPEELAAALAGRRGARAPDIIPAGSLYWSVGEERRRRGAHYTPPALTGAIVDTALRPLLAALGDDPQPAQLLESLRVCDPAMGSGAFLLAVCRRLGERLERAWQRHGAPAVSSDIPLSTLARQYVARRCLYGVEKDPCAFELARLSLWLLTRTDTPRAFARTLRCGDALVGLEVRQIAAGRLDLPAQGDDLDDTRLLRMASRESIDELRARGDALVAAFFAGERRSDAPVLPFHWQLEFPEVFARDDPGFDAFVGNPPFFWGNRIGRAFGDRYRDWLLRRYSPAHGNSDLAAYFLRRAFALLRRGGVLGFVTTNSIAEADTRETGLDPLIRAGGVLYEAVRSAAWSGSASVRVAHVFVRKGGDPGPRRLDGCPVAAIGADLRPLRAARAAVRLRERAGESFKGVDFGGTGFLLSPEQRAQILAVAPHEAACIWPVLNASRFASSPGVRPSGFIINFTGRTLAEAEQFAYCIAKIRREVLPRRAIDRRKARRERWWLYNEACSGLYRAIDGQAVALVCAVVAKYGAFAFVDARTVFTNALNVFAFDSPAALAVLQSRVHELWALTHSSSLRADPRYNPSDCFETFPFPPRWRDSEELIQAGRRYHELRGECMQRNHEGLTATYNRFHDPAERAPEIVALRERHAELDRLVLAAYGWSDLAAAARCEFIAVGDPPAPHVRPATRLRWPHAFADEVLARLLALNHARATEERAERGPGAAIHRRRAVDSTVGAE